MKKGSLSEWVRYSKNWFQYRKQFGFQYEGGFRRYIKSKISNKAVIPALPAPVPTSTTPYMAPAAEIVPTVQQPQPQPQALPVATPTQIQQHPVEKAFSELDISVRVTEDFSGPLLDVVSIVPVRGVRGNAISGAATDLARILGVQSVRVVANGIHAGGRAGTMVLEIARSASTRKEVMFAACIRSVEWRDTKAMLPVLMGVDVRGRMIIADAAHFPHAIVGGQTGGGKTVWVKTMLLGWMLKLTPQQLQIIIISPKPGSFMPFFGTPHLLKPVVTDMEQAAHEIDWLTNEMDRRLQLFADAGCEHITEYNQKYPSKKIPHIVMVNDEIADMMDVVREMMKQADDAYKEECKIERESARSEKRQMDEVKRKLIPCPERNLKRLTQKAREAGIYVILCTQRPTVAAVNGTTKSNAPTRIAFSMVSAANSITILEEGGAEILMGKGDMLLRLNGAGILKRVHGCFIDNDEIRAMLASIKRN